LPKDFVLSFMKMTTEAIMTMIVGMTPTMSIIFRVTIGYELKFQIQSIISIGRKINKNYKLLFVPEVTIRSILK
jgi:hypothetical protein